MQNLCAEVSKLGSFFEVELTYSLGLLNHARVVVVHTVDIGPYLNLLGRQSRSDERSREVATAAQQVVYLAVSVAADESLCDIYLIALVLFH